MNTAVQFFVSVQCGLMLGKTPENWRFSELFLVVAVLCWISLYPLCRIPRHPRVKLSAEQKVFWARLLPLLHIQPFRGLLYLMVCTTMMIVLGQFGTLFMTERLNITQNLIYYLSSVGMVGGVASVYGGILADRIGSKPVMQMGQALMLGGALYWLLISLGVSVSHLPVIAMVGVITMVGMMAYVVTSFRLVCEVLPTSEMVFGTILFNLSMQISVATGLMIWGKTTRYI